MVQRLNPSWRNALVSIPVLAAGPALVVLAVHVDSATGAYAGFALSVYALRNALLIQQAPGGGRAQLRLERSALTGQPPFQALLLVVILGAVIFALSHTGP